MSRIRALDLFSGIGGFRAGAMMAEHEFEFVGYCENDKYPLQGYQAMFPTMGEYDMGDIKAITRTEDDVFSHDFLKPHSGRTKRIKSRVPDHDILFAGFECQAFSSMGKGMGVLDTLERGDFIFDLVEILRVKKPMWFVLENVRGFYTHNSGFLRRAVCEHLRSPTLGYEVECWLLDAKEFGVPQTRRRTFIVGRRRGVSTRAIATPVGSPPEGYESGVHAILEREVDDAYYLSDTIKPTILSDGTGGWHAKSEINQFIARPLCKTMHKMHRASQDNYYSDAFVNGSWSEEEGLIVEANVGGDRIRRITPREALRIQSFQEPLIERLLSTGLSDTRLYMAAGNAVPPKLVAAVLGSLLEDMPEEWVEEPRAATIVH